MFRAIFGFIYIHFVFFRFNLSKDVNNNSTANVTEGPREKEIHQLDWDVWCKFQPSAYDCTGRGMLKAGFYYDIKMESCKTAEFGSCRHNSNQFSALTECNEICRDVGLQKLTGNLSEKVYCRFQQDFGNCNDYYPMWYFDMSIRACKGFSYSGCGGNHNRFPNAQICNAVCGGAVEYLINDL